MMHTGARGPGKKMKQNPPYPLPVAFLFLFVILICPARCAHRCKGGRTALTINYLLIRSEACSTGRNFYGWYCDPGQKPMAGEVMGPG